MHIKMTFFLLSPGNLCEKKLTCDFFLIFLLLKVDPFE